MQKDGLPFAEVLTAEQIDQAFAEEGVVFAQEKDSIFTPAITLWAFLSQTLFKKEQRSCLAAVARVMVLLGALSRPACAYNSGPYCRARSKLSEVVIRRLAEQVAQGCEHQVPEKWLWQGRHVKLVDGTTVSMPDTEANQEVYPQSPSQQEGVGFPLARLVVLLSLATAMLCGMEIGPYAGKETGETALFRRLLDHLESGDVALVDRYFCSYFMIALLLATDADIVTRLHQCRKSDFCRRKRLGYQDYLVTWTRPARPEWMDEETYLSMPESLTVRQLQVHVHQPGFRVESFSVVTTLTDARMYRREAVAELYHQRWLVELDIRAIKESMGMDVLRCKTPEMVRTEIWVCLLAYNLLRQTMLQAALKHQLSPRQLSFTAALQLVAASWNVLPLQRDARLLKQQLRSLSAARIPYRPNRVEPRKVKRRPKALGYLTKPRAEARAELYAGAME
jgi:hypothetical protein